MRQDGHTSKDIVRFLVGFSYNCVLARSHKWLDLRLGDYPVAQLSLRIAESLLGDADAIGDA